MSDQSTIFEFESDNEFYDLDGVQKFPNNLKNGDLVKVIGKFGEFKVINRCFKGRKLVIVCEKIMGDLFKVKWIDGSSSDDELFKSTNEVYGVSGVVRFGNCSSEYRICHRGEFMWVKAVDCIVGS